MSNKLTDIMLQFGIPYPVADALDDMVTAKIDPVTGGIEFSAGGEVVDLGGGGSSTVPTYVKLIFDGDSKTAEAAYAIDWVRAKNPLYIKRAAVIGVGGTGSGDLLSAPRMSAMLDAVASAKLDGSDVDLYLTTGTNDTPSPTFVDTVGNVAIYADAFFAAGGRYLILMSLDPKTTAGYDKVPSVNAAYEAYARTKSNVFFCDTTGVLLDFTSAVNAPIGGALGLRLSPTVDGLHCNAYGCNRKAIPLEAIATSIYRARTPSSLYKSDSYSALSPSGNLAGNNGRFTALGGTNNSTGGIVVGTPPLGWSLWNALNGLSVTFSAVTSAGAKASLGTESDIPAIRMTVSGTPSANTALILQGPLESFSGVSTGTFENELLAYADGLSGAFAIRTAGLMVTTIGDNDTSSMAASDELPLLTQLICMQNVSSVASLPSTNNAAITVSFKSGVAVSGSIDLIGFSERRIGA